ncbi:hypothetical protein K502DRAFT_333999 [Neoconidiobolus thromboides FSU 785]|nr:hypothetical protein K502DRAFT_333999 [Neoconidiobolus thromboides FSU 785]
MFDNLIDSLSNNPYFSAGFGLVGVGFGLTVAKQGSQLGYMYLKRRMLIQLEITSKDKSYPWLLNWLSLQKEQHIHQLSIETSFKQHNNGSVMTKFNFVPGPGQHFFNYKGAWFQVKRQRENKLVDLTSGAPWETITITTLTRDKKFVFELLDKARELALSKQMGKTVIYSSYGPEWRPFGQPRKKKPINSVILKDNQSDRIVKDVKEFLLNEKWYNDRGIPYRRGYLLYGPPGTGKSSFIQGLAGELDYNICLLNLSERGLTDDRLNHLMTVVPERSILLLEDIDAAFNQREQTTKQGYQSMVTFSGLLNALDGVGAAEERIIFMTTNHIEKLDTALIRPGRVDLKEYFGHVNEAQLINLFLRFYPNEKELALKFKEKLFTYKEKDIDEEVRLSAAALQGHFVRFKDSPVEALENINLLIK